MKTKQQLRSEYSGPVFPGIYMHGLDAAQCVGKWVERIVCDARWFLCKYYDPGTNYLSETERCEIGVCEDFLRDSRRMARDLTPVLEDLIDGSLNGLDDMIIALYGIGSDELYVYRAFVKLAEKYEDRGFLDGDSMGKYGYEGMNRRLQEILFHVPAGT